MGYPILLGKSAGIDKSACCRRIAQRETEVIRRGKAPKEAPKEFTDKQLDVALAYLREQIKTAQK